MITFSELEKTGLHAVHQWYHQYAVTESLNQDKVLQAFRRHRVNYQDFQLTSGYGMGDTGRDKLEKIYAEIFKGEDSLIRQQIDIESVTGEMLDNGIGYIKITSFNDKTAEQFSGALNSLTSSNLNALILDVRQNGGGSISPLKSMLNKLLPACVAATAEYANGVRKTLIETDSDTNITVPMAILVDGGTASAAELFAVALRDEGSALLIGTQTYGKAVIQGTFGFPDGTALTISNAKIIPSKSASYDGVGLKPDYVCELPAGTTPDTVSRENDSQLQKAVEILTPAAPANPENPETPDAGESNE